MIPIKTFREHIIDSTSEDFADKLTPVIADTNMINAKIISGILGITLIDEIYIDIDGAINMDGEIGLAFVILHELAHHKRIKKLGKDWYINGFTNPDRELFKEHNICEERIADRWAKHMIYRLFGEVYDGRFFRKDLDGYWFETHMARTHDWVKGLDEETFTHNIKQLVVNVRR